jgi:hypothetical protein
MVRERLPLLLGWTPRQPSNAKFTPSQSIGMDIVKSARIDGRRRLEDLNDFLIDAIFELLDTVDLRRCLFVSKKIGSRALRLLYRHPQFTSRSQFNSFLAQVQLKSPSIFGSFNN